MCTQGWVKETRVPDSDVVLFPQKHTCLTTVYAAHVPSGFLCLDDRKRDDIKRFSKEKQNHSIAVGPWARPPELFPALWHASRSHFSSFAPPVLSPTRSKITNVRAPNPQVRSSAPSTPAWLSRSCSHSRRLRRCRPATEVKPRHQKDPEETT